MAERIEGLQEEIQNVLVYRNNAWIRRMFPRPNKQRGSDEIDRSLGSIAITAHYVPRHEALIIGLEASGHRFRDIDGAPEIFGLVKPVIFAEARFQELTSIRVPKDRKEIAWVKEYPIAVEAAIRIWEAWKSEVDQMVDGHLDEMKVQGIMEC